LQREGMPFEQLVAAERAGVARKFASARDSGMQDWLIAARSSQLARKCAKRRSRPCIAIGAVPMR